MNEQMPNQKEILYSPKNWAFLAFFSWPNIARNILLPKLQAAR